MFQRLKLWLSGQSGLREAAQEAAREATREGLIEGFNQGIEDFIGHVTGTRNIENGKVKTIALSTSDVKTLRKPELIDAANNRGFQVDDSWTVAELREMLVNDIEGE